MRYIIRGRIRRGDSGRDFEIEVDAESEKHAVEKATVRLGSQQSLKRRNIEIASVEVGKDGRAEG
ncbi:MAG: 50S ribosomal protein L18Ae [Candidatus Marsarchaeota archaeon]|jgi:ribosomal protein L20A (L18A)|nr:50S ribosomal protein L18Ae [Candidatus Marsarchaeota archaeon]